MISAKYFICVSFVVFFIGLVGLTVNKKNFITSLMSIELMLLATNINFLIFAKEKSDPSGYIFCLFLLAIAAVEVVVGLALITIYYHNKNNIEVQTACNIGEE